MVQIVDAEDVFKIVDKNEQQHVLFGIFLFMWGWQQTILCIIVDHGLGQNLIIRIALGWCEVALHKGCHLIHVQVNIRNGLRFDMIDAPETGENAI